MTVLITGGCGFIGTNLVQYLDARGCKMRVLDNLSAGRAENVEGLPLSSPPELIVADIKDWPTVCKSVRGTEAVVHLAANSGVVESLENPREVWEVNVAGAHNLLEACRKEGVKKFIFASSNAALGEQTPPIDESKVPRPLSPYGASKLAGEALCTSYYHSFGLKTISLRFANCYGPYSEHKASVIAQFMKWAKEGENLKIYGDGYQSRDFIHVEDVCRAIHLALNLNDSPPGGNPWGEVFQIGTGVEITILELVKLLQKATQKELHISYQPPRRGEIRRNYSDIGKARTLLGFVPRVSLEDGLRHLWEWHNGAGL